MFVVCIWGVNPIAKPALVIVSGPPAAGKTTFSPLLARALGMPLLRLDPIKEGLADVIGHDAEAYPDRLGEAAFEELIADARSVLAAGFNIVIEGFFRAGTAEPALLSLVDLATAVTIHMRADDLVLRDRYEARSRSEHRHWIHGDRARIGTLTPELPPGLGDYLDLPIPTLTLDTTSSLPTPESVATWIRRVIDKRNGSAA